MFKEFWCTFYHKLFVNLIYLKIIFSISDSDINACMI